MHSTKAIAKEFSQFKEEIPPHSPTWQRFSRSQWEKSSNATTAFTILLNIFRSMLMVIICGESVSDVADYLTHYINAGGNLILRKTKQ